jgi:hypothetical protein
MLYSKVLNEAHKDAVMITQIIALAARDYSHQYEKIQFSVSTKIREHVDRYV